LEIFVEDLLDIGSVAARFGFSLQAGCAY
jgi:hypothetical protein